MLNEYCWNNLEENLKEFSCELKSKYKRNLYKYWKKYRRILISQIEHSFQSKKRNSLKQNKKETNRYIGGWKEIISIPIYIFQNILLNFYHMCLYYTFHIRTVSTYTFLKEKNLNALAAFYFHEIYPYLCRKFTFSTWATSSFLLFGSQENPNKTCFWIKYKACFQIKSYKNPCIHNI